MMKRAVVKSRVTLCSSSSDFTRRQGVNKQLFPGLLNSTKGGKKIKENHLGVFTRLTYRIGVFITSRGLSVCHRPCYLFVG